MPQKNTIESLLVDADSQFTYRLKLQLEDAETLPPAFERLREQRRLRFTHSVFVDQHDLFPVSVRELSDDQRAAIVQDFEVKARKFFGQHGKVDLILYPGESTVEALAPAIKKLRLAKNAKTSALNPAFRRFGEAQMRSEQAGQYGHSGNDTLDVVFVDDSFSSGHTEARAISAARIFAPGQKIRWFTYVVLARDYHSLELSGPGISQRPTAARAAFLSYGFEFYAALGPQSMDPSDCPMCAAYAKALAAVDWTKAARPGVVLKTNALVVALQPRHLEMTAEEHAPVLPEVERVLILLHSKPFPFVCSTLLRRGLVADKVSLFAHLLFLVMNLRDAMAYVPRKFIADLFVNAASTIVDDHDPFAGLLLLIASFVPTSLLLELHQQTLPLLLEKDSDDTAGALNALIMANNHQLFSRIADHANTSSVMARIVRKPFHALVRVLTEHFADADDRDLLPLHLSALSIMAEKPRPENELWLSKTLCKTLDGGQHATFYRHLLQDDSVDIETLRQSMLQCLGLIKRILNLAALVKENDAARFMDQIRGEPDKPRLRQVSDRAITECWDDCYRAHFVYSDTRLISVLVKARDLVADHAARQGLTCQPFEIVSYVSYQGGWVFLGPFDRLLLTYFENLWENTLKHFYQTKQSNSEHYRRLATDTNFTERGPVVRVGMMVFDEANDHEHFAVIFSDRCKAPPADAFSGPGGLSSGRVHLEGKEGGVDYYHSSNAPIWLLQELTFWKTDQSIYKNHYVTRFSILNKSRDAKARTQS